MPDSDFLSFLNENLLYNEKTKIKCLLSRVDFSELMKIYATSNVTI